MFASDVFTNEQALRDPDDPDATPKTYPEPPALVTFIQNLWAQVAALRVQSEAKKAMLAARIQDKERELVAWYCCYYPDVAQSRPIPPGEICMRTVVAVEAMVGRSFLSQIIDHN